MKRSTNIIVLSLVCMVLLISWLFLPSINEKRNLQRISSVTVNSQKSTSSRSVVSSENTYSESSSSKTKAILKLHDSTLKPPSEEQCKAAQKRSLSGLSTKERQTVQDDIRGMHMNMESEFIEKDIRTILKSPSNPNWEFWEHTGTVSIAGEATVDNPVDGEVWIQALQKIYDIVKDTDLKADIQKMQDCVRSAVKNHDVNKLDELHKMLHDCDYWVVNYPVHFEKYAPVDWGGIDVYFNSLQCIKGN